MNMKNLNLNFLKALGISIPIAMVFKLLIFRPEDFFDFDLILISIMVLIVWQGNSYIDKSLNNKYNWLANTKKRFVIQSVVTLLFTSLIFFIFMFMLHQLRFHDFRLINRKMIESYTPALFLTFAVLAFYIGRQFFMSLKQSMIDVEKYKTESANAQLQILKNQINPHFLFNNLSVLSSLIYKSQDKAVDFINELSKVYRYVLDNNSELVPLKEEMEFLDHYIYLLKIRFDNSISFRIEIDEANKNDYLPPMCLQTLVENTIQHNEASQTNPLEISIFTKNSSLFVENPIQPRSDLKESSKTGLDNIQARYSFFTEDKVEIIKDDKVFRVKLPLIKLA
jgi:two-component system LytT family sensor kinase